MSAPYVLRVVVDRQAVAGKDLVFEGESLRPGKDLVLCLIKHPSALNLVVSSNDLYSDPATGLAVAVDERGETRKLKAYLPKGKALSAEQTAQLKDCSAGA